MQSSAHSIQIKRYFNTGLLLPGVFTFGLLSAAYPAISWAQSTQLPSTLKADQRIEHQFEYRSSEKLTSVAVAGSFNNWDKNANLLSSDTEGKIWRTTLQLPFGKHTYKFVLNGDNWTTDSKAAKNEDDGNGNVNSVLLITPPDYAKPASTQDGVIARSALQHWTSVPHLNYDRGRLTVSLRARPNDLKQVWVRAGKQRIPMTVIYNDELYARYSAQIPWNRKSDLAYSFELIDGTKTQSFGTNGLTSTQARPFRLKAKQFKPYTVPNWVEKTVFYQIFPDRFANGNKANDSKDVVPWNAKPEWFNRFGGDVQGVQQHLPHLIELGISGVYFNPIFQAPSNHRYDAEDFKSIDREFGTNAEFAALTRELQSKGIRTVLDFVFNHTATTFPQFKDIREKGEASKFKDWYFIKSYPVKVQENPNYVAWWNYPSMPKLNLLNPETSNYMLDLVNYWNKEIPLAGLRLDVANEVEAAFWQKLRERTKSLNPDMWIVGEVWGDGSPWLQGDQWDSVMNYQFLFTNRDFFAERKTSPSQYAKRLMQIYNSYVPQVSRNMMNLLSSHDTARFLTTANNNQDLHRLAATVQFTWPGAPSIYYGEELGMEGGNDPDNRRGMQWDLATKDNPMLSYYKKLIRLRNSNQVLQSGDPHILMTDDKNQTLAYSRVLNNEIAIIAINRSDKTQTINIPLPKTSAFQSIPKSGLVDGLTGKRITVGSSQNLQVGLAPLRAAILLPAKRAN